jgi:hypothetical protein
VLLQLQDALTARQSQRQGVLLQRQGVLLQRQGVLLQRQGALTARKPPRAAAMHAAVQAASTAHQSQAQQCRARL